MNFDSVGIIGGGESGIGSALLAKAQNKNVFLSEFGSIHENYKKELLELEIPFEEEGHSLEKLKALDLIVKSPGVGDETEVIKELKRNNKFIISEIEFGFYFTRKKIIAVTGSNGKTTTTGLIYHLLKEARVQAKVGGNIGESFARLVANEEEETEVYVLELSSFQLDGIKKFKPEIAVLLNITPDHLDRYDHKFENYAKAKWRIAMNQTDKDVLIVNHNLEAQKVRSRKIEIKEKNYNTSRLLTKSGDFFEIENSSLIGQHNRFNALCAIEAVTEYGLSKQSIENGLITFINVPHRLQKVDTIDGVTYINDSKATNVDAVYYALEAMKTPVIWIVGGTDKGNDYSPIKPMVDAKVKHLIMLGKDNLKLKSFFGDSVEFRSMVDAVNYAASIAEKGDVILLSPACASFDLFKNYEDRGEQFIQAVAGLRKNNSMAK